jgi:glycerol-3-phosphate dehydrogenase subunit C
MPKLEHGDLEAVAAAARAVARDLIPHIEDGRRVIALVPSCALMLKFEWPLIVPDDADVRRLAAATSDISEYMVDIARDEGMAPGMQPLAGGITVHLACHARAQNMGPKAADMLRLVPETEVSVIERCSGHGGSWGIMKDNFEFALKVGKPVARQAMEGARAHLVSECPLAGIHIAQGMERLHAEGASGTPPTATPHPIELMARAYGL